MAVKEELIKIRTVVEGAAASTAELERLDRATDEAGNSSSKAAAQVKQLSAAAKGSAPAMASATTASNSLAASQTKTAAASKFAQGGLQALQGTAAPLTASLTGATTATAGLTAASQTLGASMSAALGPIGLVVGALAMIGSAIFDAIQKKEEDRKAAAEWAREYTQRSAEIVRARDEVVRAHKAQIEISTADAQVETLEYELELMTLLGASVEAVAEKQAEIVEAKDEAMAIERSNLRQEQQVLAVDRERAESALTRLQAERNKAAAIDDSKKRTEALRAVEEQILDAQEAVTSAISAQNAARERGVDLAQQQLDIERQRKREEAKDKRDAIEIVKAEAVAAWSGAVDKTGMVSTEAIEGARQVVIAAGGSEADADEVTQKIIEGTYSAPKKMGGGKKPKKEEKIEARFGDYRDVLKAYADSRAGVDAKALDSLAKGMMPKDHKPETSITVTNNNNYSFDSQIVIDGKDKASRVVAQDIAAFFRAEIEKATRQTQNGLVR